MFSNQEQLNRKTPINGIRRKEFINLLVDEYYETTNVGKHFASLRIIGVNKVILIDCNFEFT